MPRRLLILSNVKKIIFVRIQIIQMLKYCYTTTLDSTIAHIIIRSDSVI